MAKQKVEVEAQICNGNTEITTLSDDWRNFPGGTVIARCENWYDEAKDCRFSAQVTYPNGDWVDPDYGCWRITSEMMNTHSTQHLKIRSTVKLQRGL